MNKGYIKNNDAYRLVLTQFFWVLALFPFIHAFWDKPTAISATLGGFICLVPNWFLYRCLFAHYGAQEAKRILNGFYLGEFGKIIITAILLSAAFNTPGVLPASLLIGFVVTQLFFWFAPFVVVFIYPKIKILVS